MPENNGRVDTQWLCVYVKKYKKKKKNGPKEKKQSSRHPWDERKRFQIGAAITLLQRGKMVLHPSLEIILRVDIRWKMKNRRSTKNAIKQTGSEAVVLFARTYIQSVPRRFTHCDLTLRNTWIWRIFFVLNFKH